MPHSHDPQDMHGDGSKRGPRIVVSTTGTVVAGSVRRATTFVERGRGLLGRGLDSGEALVIDRARQVHTLGMRYAIDVCFCDRDGRVVHVVRAMRPGRITRWVPRAAFVIEMRAGAMPPLRPGDQLSFEELSDR